MTVADFAEITKAKPEKKLTRTVKRTGGRNNHGHITTRHRGGGHKRRYRIIDFRRDKDGVPAKVAAIEYDPNRTARIALLHYADGEKRYILAPDRRGGGRRAHVRPRRPTSGRATRCRSATSRSAPSSTTSSSRPARGGQIDPLGRLRRPADGQGGRLRPDPPALRRGPPGALDCRATVGQLGNIEHANVRVRQGRPEPLAGHPPDRPRRRHEPGRPPEGRRRGQVAGGQPAPGLALGPEDQGPQDAQQQADRQVHRPRRKPGVRNTPQ